jgi:hypothetical protein
VYKRKKNDGNDIGGFFVMVDVAAVLLYWGKNVLIMLIVGLRQSPLQMLVAS